jgi:hypothetical protein
VDAVFVDRVVAGEVYAHFQQLGYEVKIVRIDELVIEEIDQDTFTVTRIVDGEAKPLPPFRPSHEFSAHTFLTHSEKLNALIARYTSRM